MPNAIDNPSLETGAGNPRIPDGWVNVGLDAGDTQDELAVLHSGVHSLRFNVGAADEGIRQQITAAVGAFAIVEVWSYGDGSAGFTIGGLNATQMRVQHSATAYNVATPHVASWQKTVAVFRVVAANPSIYVLADAGAAGARYLDDVAVKVDDPVSLTVTPASAANSAEASGLRVDGHDLATQLTFDGDPINATLDFDAGLIRWRWTPRHDAAQLAAFNAGVLPLLLYGFGDATNWIILDVNAANSIRLWASQNAVAGNAAWACAGQIVAGTTYEFEVEYSAGGVWVLRVDGVDRATFATGVDFSTIVNSLFWGSSAGAAQQIDATYSAPS